MRDTIRDTVSIRGLKGGVLWRHVAFLTKPDPVIAFLLNLFERLCLVTAVNAASEKEFLFAQELVFKQGPHAGRFVGLGAVAAKDFGPLSKAFLVLEFGEDFDQL